MRIGLPRALLAIDLVAELAERIRKKIEGLRWQQRALVPQAGPLLVSEDICFPFKRMLSESVSLAQETGVVFVPRLVGTGENLLCPNFRALPDIVALNLKQQERKVSGKLVSVTLEELTDAALAAAAEGAAEHLRALMPGREQPQPPSPATGTRPAGPVSKPSATGIRTPRTIAVLGHPYMLADEALGGRVPQMLRQYGCRVATAEDVPLAETEHQARRLDFYAKKLYWRPARRLLGAFMHYLYEKPPAGILHLVPFNCGLDALLRIEMMNLYKKEKAPPPFLVIVCDQHSQRDHVATRLEAFLDIIDGIKIT